MTAIGTHVYVLGLGGPTLRVPVEAEASYVAGFDVPTPRSPGPPPLD